MNIENTYLQSPVTNPLFAIVIYNNQRVLSTFPTDVTHMQRKFISDWENFMQSK
jgi:hypothetical protein